MESGGKSDSAASFEELTNNAKKVLGISREDLIKRRVKAAEPHTFVSQKTDQKFNVQSTTRSMQIMTEGIREQEFTKRQESIRTNSRTLIGVRCGLVLFSCVLTYWMSSQFLIPMYNTVQERNRRWQIRYDRAQAALRGAQQKENIQAATFGEEMEKKN